jgi:hypothetical protein
MASKNEKLMERCFQLLAFRTGQFLDLSKANEKMTKGCKNTPKRLEAFLYNQLQLKKFS